MFCFQASPYLDSQVLQASPVKEEKKVTKDIQGRLCQDQVEEMDSRALLGSLDLLDLQAMQVRSLRDHFTWSPLEDRLQGQSWPRSLRGLPSSHAVQRAGVSRDG